MDSEVITVSVLLEYLYNQFAVTFILCLIGAFIRHCVGSKMQEIRASKMVAFSLFAAVLVCAIREYVDGIPFSIYVTMSILMGMWSVKLLNLFLNEKLVGKFLHNFFKNMTDPISKSLSNTFDEVEKEKKTENIPKQIEDKNEST